MTDSIRNRVIRGSAPLLLMTIACLAFGLWAYPRLPARVPTHWNIHGQVDGYSGKAFAMLFFPAFTMLMYLLFAILPLIDPNRAKYEQFAGAYGVIRASMIVFMNGIYLIMMLAGLGYAIDTGLLVRGGVSLLFIVMGDQMGRIKQNWFVGVRVPWTMVSNENWRKTHRFAAKTMVAGGMLSLLTLPFRSPAVAIAGMGVVILGAMAPVLYSYLLFRKSENHGQ